jgi:RHS repeat-associated protein
MTEAKTTANGSTQTDIVYSYDTMGRVKDLWQCAPYNCGSSSIWHMAYVWDLAGDMLSYTNPAGFAVTRTVDSAQQVTSQTYGTNMAVSSITYEPWGAISTMCGGQGCTKSQETRQYNSRLQPVLMELGNSSNLSADYCLAYNYYSSQGTPSSCVKPSEGTGDNGDILGTFRQDSTNSSYGHAFTFTYDGVNRLKNAVATGSPAYNMTYDYDQYGNMWCDGSSGGLPCAQSQYNTGNNRLTYIGSQAVTYDAAGNQLDDQYNDYQYDAEGRVKLSSSLSNPLSQCPTSVTPGPWQCPMYNALGQRVEDYQADSQGNALTLTYPVDITGRRVGTWDQWPAQNWTGWDVYWERVAGQHISMGGGDSWLAHSDAVDSTAMVTDETGAVVWDQVFGPWGQIWQQTGTRPWFVFGGLRWPVNDPLHPSATREFSSNVFRWMTPDPDNAGADVGDSQSWDMYSYAGDNPTTRNDPSGEDYKICTQNGDQDQCTVVQNEAAFQSALANPGSGITVAGNNDSGTIYGTNASGQRVQAGTYEEVAGPGSEGGGLQNDIGAELTIAGGIAAGVQAAAGLVEAGVNAVERLLGVESGENAAVVIGKVPDLAGPGALTPGERTLELPDLQEPKANWLQNSSKLREAMGEGRPIRDVTAQKYGGLKQFNTGFLRAERNLLENHGWTYSNGYWYPPGR